ncbi:MAG: SPFH domain-containing protein [Burkholderiaceae bacterium]
MELQQALRVVISDKPIDQIMQTRQSIGEVIEGLVDEKMRAIGVEVSSVGIKELTW